MTAFSSVKNTPREGRRFHEWLTVGILVAVGTALRFDYLYHYRVNSDETQHLHVVWAWTQGLLPYRDFFDNHAPLFHIIMAPLLSHIGERPDIVSLARMAMLPLWATMLWATWSIARSLYGKHAGLWAVALLTFAPSFFFCSLEFRTDVLWATFWLLALAVVFGGSLSWKRALVTGLLLGLSLSTSLKSLFLIAALAISAALLPHLVAERPARSRTFPPLRGWLPWMTVGVLLVPAAIVTYFAHAGALPAMWRCTLGHNLPSAEHSILHRFVLPALLPLALALVIFLTRASLKQPQHTGMTPRRAFLFLVCGIHTSLVVTLAPIVQRQDLLPLFPLLCVLIAGTILAAPIPRRLRRPGRVRHGYNFQSKLVRFLATIELLGLIAHNPITANATVESTRLIGETIALTSPRDTIFDLKGETVYRRRCYPPVLESFTRKGLRAGLVEDRVPEACRAHKARVSIAAIPKYLPRARAFVESNFIRVGSLRVAGFALVQAHRGEPISFDVRLPDRYALVSQRGAVSGILDGSPYLGPRLLAAGTHVFVPGRETYQRSLALVWAQAVERGFSPFSIRKPIQQ